jgi:hypothetical protein
VGLLFCGEAAPRGSEYAHNAGTRTLRATTRWLRAMAASGSQLATVGQIVLAVD